MTDNFFKEILTIFKLIWLLSVVVGISLLGFGVWIIIKLLGHFGVI